MSNVYKAWGGSLGVDKEWKAKLSAAHSCCPPPPDITRAQPGSLHDSDRGCFLRWTDAISKELNNTGELVDDLYDKLDLLLVKDHPQTVGKIETDDPPICTEMEGRLNDLLSQSKQIRYNLENLYSLLRV